MSAPKAFLTAVAEALGPQAVYAPDEVQRASASLADWGWGLPGVVRAESVEHVQTILRLAVAHGASVAPWSRGRNWGYGTRLAPNGDTFGLDLSAMKAIRAYNPRAGTLTVEPGVSQAQAAAWLRVRDAGHYLDVTGASPDTSVVGNLLERGIAYNSLRAESVRHLEVVLPDGRCIRTGFGWLDNEQVADMYRFGIGPNLTELFMQSNLGVVTAATLALRPVPEQRIAVRIPLGRPQDLAPFLETLGTLKAQLKLDAIFHVGDQERSVTTLAPMLRAAAERNGWTLHRDEVESIVRRVVPAGWAALGQIEGTRGHCRHALDQLRRGLKPYATVHVLDPVMLRRQRWLAERAGLKNHALLAEASIEMSGLTAGETTSGPMRGVYWPYFDDEPSWAEPEHGRSGWLLLAPLFPPWANHVEVVLDVIREEAQRADVRLGITVNLLSATLAQAIVSLSWRRDDDGASARAHAAQRRATERLLALGYPPYRAALGEMDVLQAKGATFFSVAARLKRALDPYDVLAPGRYIPEP